MSDSLEAPVVHIETPERMNLMGLLMRGLLEAALRDNRVRRRARRLRGDVRIVAGTMSVTLRFTKEQILLLANVTTPARATVRGEMKPLLEVVAGESLVRPVLSRKVRVGGNLLLLLRMLPLIRAPRAD
ncbi:MAG: SCP2 sterol-binding domain-containing protein [Planctomycetes bacterium]|nr:SCP2 sterol-binding domain-containing protein [Planctomycetota bacterium]